MARCALTPTRVAMSGCVAQIVEELVQVPVMLELASDLLDRQCPMFRDDTAVFVSQSGETADTLEALRYAKEHGAFCVGITNTVGSAISRATECGVHINAGCEIGVASTKVRPAAAACWFCAAAGGVGRKRAWLTHGRRLAPSLVLYTGLHESNRGHHHASAGAQRRQAVQVGAAAGDHPKPAATAQRHRTHAQAGASNHRAGQGARGRGELAAVWPRLPIRHGARGASGASSSRSAHACAAHARRRLLWTALRTPIRRTRSPLKRLAGGGASHALQGALKVKEVSLMHSEGIPAGEMKHGPLALVDERLPLIVVATKDGIYKRQQNVIQQLRARSGRLIVLCSEDDADMAELENDGCHVIKLPTTVDCLQSIINIVPLQLLSYHLAVLRGHDVDRPRNLAKSVTVE